ncbi:MipA/OmpV family protein [Halobacteriovorax sp. ZH5_bin.2]|uniref:MipA/OmpV family protein n=1 Tax=unclassified Halobacteriovorax TaxID=2639665 RepID=UPI003720F75D
MRVRLPSSKKLFFKIITLGAVVISAPAFSNGRTERINELERQKSKRPPPTNQVGLGTSFSSSLYKVGDQFDIPVVPSINYNYKRFSFRGIAASFRLFPLTNLTLTPDFNKVEAEAGTYNDGLKERDRSLDLGITFLLPSKWFMTRFSYTHDISGRSEASKYYVSVSKAFPIEPWKGEKIVLIPGLTYSQYSDNWSRYYFGVSSAEARAGRPEYTPGASHQLSARLIVNYPIGKKYVLNSFYSYTKYSAAVEDSPLTKRGYRESIFLGLNYILGESTR